MLTDGRVTNHDVCAQSENTNTNADRSNCCSAHLGRQIVLSQHLLSQYEALSALHLADYACFAGSDTVHAQPNL